MKQGAQLVYRLVDVLKGLASADARGVGMTELAQTTGLKGPTVHRLLQAMVDLRLAYQQPGDRRYVLGPLLFELGRTAGRRFDLQPIADREVDTLATATGDTAFFLVRSSTNMLCLSRASGSFPVKTLITDVGTMRPMGLGAGGLAVLSSLPETEASDIMNENSTAYAAADRSVTSIAEEVALARACGYVRRETPALGVTTVAIAVKDTEGYPFASVSVGAISPRMQGEHFSSVLQKMQAAVARIESGVDLDGHHVSRYLSA